MALLAAAALALGACGGDDGGEDVGATQPGANTGTTDTTGTTRDGTTTRERETTTREGGTTTRERGSTTREKGDDSGGNRGSGGNDSGSTAEPPAQPGNVRKVAETVCNSFLPKPIQRDIEQGDRKPEDVARNYARGFPERQREAAYEGCLAGLKKRD